jgi:hypothetical protein
MLTLLLVAFMLLLIVGALPTWPYSRAWGFFPAGSLGLVLIVVVVLSVLGRI